MQPSGIGDDPQVSFGAFDTIVHARRQANHLTFLQIEAVNNILVPVRRCRRKRGGLRDISRLSGN
jgi:hypothetical protein